MAILIDPPSWPAHGRLWAHLVSDESYAELHAFAAANGIPRRGFERDHYDVPAERYQALVVAGALPVSGREVVRRLARTGLRRRKSESMARRALGHELLRPERLHVGDRVAIVAPAGPVDEDRLDAGAARLASWGLTVEVSAHARDTHPSLAHLAGTDEHRAADFAAAWTDPTCAGIVAAQGGSGTQRMIDLLDWRRLAEERPKVVVGFSDITALHQGLASRLGLASILGPVVCSLADASECSAESLRRLLMEPDTALSFELGGRSLVDGVATGVLVGGNLKIVSSELATPTSRAAEGGIAVIEDVGVTPGRLDRMLRHLVRSGWFDGVRGVICGAFTDCGEPREVEAILADVLPRLGVPVVAGVDIGHTSTSMSLPLGVAASLDAASGRLTLDRAALA